MTHRDEILKLVALSPMQCRIVYNEQGYIDGVFIGDKLYDPLSFAEFMRPRVATGRTR